MAKDLPNDWVQYLEDRVPYDQETERYQLPEPHTRAIMGGRPLALLQLQLVTSTVLFGGGPVSRKVDADTEIRPSIVRPMLRFWWRALHGHLYKTPKELMAKENELWGSANDDKHEGRSPIEIRVDVQQHSKRIERANVTWKDPASYALWPARSQRNGSGPAERWPAGIPFDLTLYYPKEYDSEMRSSLRAWILFGGVGSRTRRGCGSIAIRDEKQRQEWLPQSGTQQALEDCFGSEILTPIRGSKRSDLPLLAGASLCVASPEKDGEKAWHTTLNWLKDFRQGQPTGNTGSPERFARARGNDRRPGRSHWPESDKVRHLSGKGPWAHEPQHNETPVWPRASFGLPINAQFQKNDASGQRYSRREPNNFELQWRDANKKPRSRLGSPLVLKPMALADGRFVPIALWLYRGFPEGGEVGLRNNDSRHWDSYTPFDELVADGDEALYAPLDEHQDAPKGLRMQRAFFTWLRGRRVTEITEEPGS